MKNLQLKIVKKVIKNGLNVKKTEELINKELLKIAGEELKNKSKRELKVFFQLNYMLIL